VNTLLTDICIFDRQDNFMNKLLEIAGLLEDSDKVSIFKVISVLHNSGDEELRKFAKIIKDT
jgi:hypothetical protein